MRLLVIDGNSIANRAFYGIKLLTTKDGRYTNARCPTSWPRKCRCSKSFWPRWATVR